MVAALRYRHWLGGAKPLVFADEHARLFLDWRDMLLAAPTPIADRAIGRLLGPVRGIEGEVLARARFVDEVLKEKMAEGSCQAIILGAGFDTTALRYAGKGLPVFEVDHPATQAEKRAILDAKGLGSETTYVPVDFAKDDLPTRLIAAGYDRSVPSVTSWLGVTMYLDQAVSIATLVGLRTILATGSEIVFDAFPRTEELAADEQVMFGAMKAFTASRGEPMTPWNSDAFAVAIADKGYEIVEILRGPEMRARWFKGQPMAIHPPKAATFYRLRAI